ncbi:MAG: flagellar hook-length control protein FliK [Desulfobacteraceae bacterium]|jgi:flagellar hook-length control protein FliK
MPIDLFNTQLVAQQFSPGKDLASVADAAGSKSLHHSQSHDASGSNDQDFLKTLERVNDNQQSSYNSNSPNRQERAVGKERPLSSGPNIDTSDSLDHTNNFIGASSHIQTENNVVAGLQNIDPANISLLDLFKQLGLEFLLTEGYSRIDEPIVQGKIANSDITLEHENAVANKLPAINLSKLETLLMHLQAVGNPNLSDQNGRRVQLITSLSGNQNPNSTKDLALQVDAENLKEALNNIPETQSINEKTTLADLLRKISSQLPQSGISGETTEGDKTLLKRLEAGLTSKDTNGGKNLLAQNLTEVNRLNSNPSKQPAAEIGQNVQKQILKSDLRGNPVANSQSAPFVFNPASHVNHGNAEPTGKMANLNPGPVSADKVVAQILTVESDAKDGGLLFNQSQNEVKTPEAKLVTPETQMLQKEFRSQTVNQIVQKAVLLSNAGQHEVRLDLKPEFLGHIRMQIITESQQVTVRILTEYPMVKELIENNLQQLKTELQNHGLEIDELDVSVEDDANQHVADRKMVAQAKLKSLTENGEQSEDNPSNDAKATAVGSIRNEGSNRIDFFA